jgi:hypothetical protein
MAQAEAKNRGPLRKEAEGERNVLSAKNESQRTNKDLLAASSGLGQQLGRIPKVQDIAEDCGRHFCNQVIG